MKKYIYRIIMMALFLVSIVCIEAGASNNSPLSLYSYSNTAIEGTRINNQMMNGMNVIIMPSSADMENVKLYCDIPNGADIYAVSNKTEEKFVSGMSFNMNEFNKNGSYLVKFVDKNGIVPETVVQVIFSENLTAMYLVSEKPSTNGRLWVEASADKSNKAKGSLVMQKENGEIVYNGALTQIKGRGNSTWGQIKKPYQIKTSESVDLLQTGNDSNKSKTWVLLANYFDTTLLNNHYALKIGKALGMKSYIEGTHVDLYYDGEYRGTYMLSEKVEVGKGRVNITDLQKKNEESNEGVDIEKLPVKSNTTKSGIFYTYCANMKSPEDITGGYLLEMDFEERAKEEVCYFRTTRGQYVVVKSPEFASKEEMEYISSLYQEYEDAVYNGGVNPSTGKKYSDYVDKESIASYYIVNELSKAKDFFTSSAYLYKNSGEDKMSMGPLWDYDLSFGKSRYESHEDEPSMGENIYNTNFGRTLIQIPDFANTVNTLYGKIYPILTDVILGDKNAVGEDGSIHSVYYEKERVAKSSLLNNLLWGNSVESEEDINKFISFLSERAEFLKITFDEYTKRTPGKVNYYGDVSENNWFYNDVMEMTEKGCMGYMYNSFFDPYFNAKRHEVALCIFKLSGDKEPALRPVYKDVDPTICSNTGAIMWTYENDIMNGYPGGYFYPYSFIRREEVATILYRYKNEPSVSGDLSSIFADSENISDYAKDAVLWAYQNKIMIGDDNKCVNPRGYITRAELAAVINRASKL